MTPIDTFNQSAREIATELYDTGGHYLLSEEQFAALTAAAQELVGQTLGNLPTSIELSRSKLAKGPVLPPDDPDKDKVYVAGVPLRAVTDAIAALTKENQHGEN